ncbi:MAG: hypothetical protein AABZ64_03260 [Nitrospinota bacterium]
MFANALADRLPGLEGLDRIFGQDGAGFFGVACGAFPEVLAVGVLAPEAAIAEHHLVAVDIVAETETAETQTVLPLTRTDALKLLDGVPLCMVEGILAEDSEGNSVLRSEFRMAPRELTGQTIKVGRGDNAKWRHRESG